MSLEHQWLHQLEEEQIKISSQFSTIGKTNLHRVAKLCMLHVSSLRQPYVVQLLIQKRFYLYTYSFTTNSLYPSSKAIDYQLGSNRNGPISPVLLR